jgi:hypothetical protein
VNIVLPIVFASVILGLCVKRITPAHWIALVAWIIGVIAVAFVKGH